MATAKKEQSKINGTDGRYHRQELVIGSVGQKKLQKACVGIVGGGALGTVAAELLARAGVGGLNIVDRDVIELSNLQRQVLFCEEDVGKSKAETIKKRLLDVNSDVRVVAHAMHLNSGNISLLQKCDVIIDATDNLNTRFLINDFARKNKIPWIYGAALRDQGFVMPIVPGGACLSCFLKPAQLETCDLAGVLGTATMMVATLQVQFAMQILIGMKVESVLKKINLRDGSIATLAVKKSATCKTCCGEYEYLNSKTEGVVQFCSTGRFQIPAGVGWKSSQFEILKKKWSMYAGFSFDEVAIHLPSISLFRDGRALVKAKTKEEAISVYAKLVGN